MEVVGRRRYELNAATEYELPDTEGNDIKRDDGERVGVQRGGKCQRQIDAKDQAAQRGTEHLEGARNQAAEKSRRDGASCRVAIQVPQTRVEQGAGEWRQPAIVVNRLVTGNESFDEFAHGFDEF